MWRSRYPIEGKRTMRAWEGIYAILPSAFTRKGEIDQEAIRYSVDYLIRGGVHGVVPLGSVGEFPFLSSKDKRKIIDVVIDQVAGKVPVIVGTSCMGTDETIKLSNYAKNAGADGVMVNLPIYFQLTDEDVYNHYKLVSSEVAMPVFLYNFPETTHIDLTPEKVVKLSEIENVVGIKESINDVKQIEEVIKRVKKKPFSVFTGSAMNLLEVLKLGGAGAFDPISNIDPKTVVEIYDAFKAGNMRKAVKMQNKVLGYRSLLQLAGMSFHAGLKEIMRAVGHPIEPIVKRPLPPLTEEQRKLIRKRVRKQLLSETSV